MNSLRTRLPDGTNIRVPIGSRAKTIGRDETADVVVTDPTVSRFHCSVSALPNGLRVQDLDSTGGTLVNGKRVTTAVMKNGDQLQVGSMTFEAECEVPVGFGTAIRKVEEQFAVGKGFRTILGEIAAEGQPGAGGSVSSAKTQPPMEKPPPPTKRPPV